MKTPVAPGLRRFLARLLLALALVAAPALAFAGPRSGSSFGGRLGFRNGGGYSMPRSSGSGYGYNNGGGYNNNRRTNGTWSNGNRPSWWPF